MDSTPRYTAHKQRKHRNRGGNTKPHHRRRRHTYENPERDSDTVETLSDLQVGQTGVVVHVHSSVCEKLSSMGIRRGQEITVDAKQPFNGPIVVTSNESTTSLSRRYADKIVIGTIKQRRPGAK